MRALRVGFAGTPDFAAQILLGLLEVGRRPEIVYTQPDRPVGRGRKVRASPVKQLADRHGLPVHQPVTLREPDAARVLSGFGLDVLVVAAYGLILPEDILEAPRLGCINVHASILPRWRGAAPIERAIMAGDRVTGVSIMRMDRGLDTGPVYRVTACPIGSRATGPTLEAQLAELGRQALIECLESLPDAIPTPQPAEGVTYARKLTELDARIDWSRSADALDRQVRALCGRLPARTFAGTTRIRVLEAFPGMNVAETMQQQLPGTVIGTHPDTGISVACGQGVLNITRLQIDRGKGSALDARQALNGFPDLVGQGRKFNVEPS